jgi:enamine deaminase RidA (YjgF/YER057c/UK114 family)
MSERKIIIPKGSEAQYERLHFAPAVAVGDRLFCSGAIGTAPDGKIPAEPEAQFTQAFENLKSVLEAGGSSLDDIIEMTTFHVGFSSQVAAFMAVKEKFIQAPYPAWTAIGVSELGFGALVEIKVVAQIRS